MSTIGELWAEIEGMDTRSISVHWFRRMQSATLQLDMAHNNFSATLRKIALEDPTFEYAGKIARLALENGGITLHNAQKNTLINNMIDRLEAAGHDERLASGSLYLEAAAMLRTLSKVAAKP